MLGKGPLAGTGTTVSPLADFGALILGGFGTTGANVISQGQKYRAVMVIEVSRQFENVLVEQNDCQGLNIVIRS
jgi:hypothetical protein